MRTDRLTPLRSALRQCHASPSEAARSLGSLVEQVASELRVLERQVQTRPRRKQTEGSSIRIALELLRGFGRLSALDFSEIPDEDRHLLVRLLALEHRWCYAAAGTTRGAFKRATGRTGAR